MLRAGPTRSVILAERVPSPDPKQSSNLTHRTQSAKPHGSDPSRSPLFTSPRVIVKPLLSNSNSKPSRQQQPPLRLRTPPQEPRRACRTAGHDEERQRHRLGREPEDRPRRQRRAVPLLRRHHSVIRERWRARDLFP